MMEVMVSVPAWAMGAPTSIRRLLPDVVWEIVMLEAVVVPMETLSTAATAHAEAGASKNISSAIASKGALIVFLWLPVADPSVDLRFAIKLITLVCAFLLTPAAGPRHKKGLRSNKGRPLRIHIGYPLRQPV